jgi:hypothetical protein
MLCSQALIFLAKEVNASIADRWPLETSTQGRRL